MKFIVEPGTGKFDANALVDVMFVDQYADDMGDIRWAADAATLSADALLLKKQRAIVVASRWLSAGYIWKGATVLADQPLAWPRIIDDSAVLMPIEVKFAVAEAASRIYAGADLSPDLERGGAVASEKVGPIAVTYATEATPGTTYSKIDSYVRNYILGGLNTLFITTERV